MYIYSKYIVTYSNILYYISLSLSVYIYINIRKHTINNTSKNTTCSPERSCGLAAPRATCGAYHYYTTISVRLITVIVIIIIIVIVIIIIIIISSSSIIIKRSLPTNIVDFGELDSSTLLIVRVGIPRPIGDFPESLTQAMLVGIMLVGRLGVLLVMLF